MGLKRVRVRVVSGTVLLALVLAALWVQGPLLLALVALATGLGAHELYTMARRAGYSPMYPMGVALALLLGLRGYLGTDSLSLEARPGPGVAAEVMVLTLVLIVALAQEGVALVRLRASAVDAGQADWSRWGQMGWANVGITLGGALYTGGLLGYAPLLAALPAEPNRAGGTEWLLMVLLGTAACDTGAYFVGSTVSKRTLVRRKLKRYKLVQRGRRPNYRATKLFIRRKVIRRKVLGHRLIPHKLIPHISPAKTWEGLAGGTLGAVIAAVALSGLLQITIIQAIVLGLLVCAAAVAGDLCESMIKRAARVKDSGQLIPGHGGILDRLDSILFVLLAVYWFVQVAVQG